MWIQVIGSSVCPRGCVTQYVAKPRQEKRRRILRFMILRLNEIHISSRVIDWLKEKHDIRLLYFYIDVSDYRPKDLRDVLVALLQQLDPNYAPNYKTCAEIRDDLYTSLARTDRPVYIVIDAIDRLNPSNEDWLLQQFVQQCQAKARVAVLITSTDSEALKDLDVTEKLEIEVGRNGSANDIRKYVENKLQQIKCLVVEGGDIKNISEKLVQNADGMFLYAMLQVESICQNKTQTGVLESFEHFSPPNRGRITDMYDKIVDGFESGPEMNQRIAKSAVALLTHATRLMPMREFLIALAVDRADRRSESGLHGIYEAYTAKCERLQNLHVDLLSELERDPKIVIRACGALVRIDEQVGVFRFCHASAYDYFKKKEPKWSGPLVADITLSYLCCPGLSEGPCKDASWYNSEPLEHYLQDYPLLEFASRHWAPATRTSYAQSRDRLVEFCRRPQNMQLSFQVLSLAERKPMVMDICPSHIVSYFGLVKFFDYLGAERLLDPLQCDDHGLTAMHWAIESETNVSYEMVGKLIRRGADVNAKDTGGRTPLYYASRNGKLDVVELLLEKGAEVDSQSEKHYTALMVASSKGHESVVRKLIKSDADVKITSDMGTALHAAAASGAEKCVSMILEQGRLNLDVDGDRFGTPLHTAAFYGHHQIVKALLDHGFRVSKKSKKFGSTLAVAAAGCHDSTESGPYLQTFQVLLQHGAKVNDQGGLHGTALHAAAAYGHADLVELLLDKGAAVNAQGPSGTPYQMARNGRHLEVMELLANRGADTNSSSNDDAASIDHPSRTSLNQAWILAFQVAVAANDKKRIDYLVTIYERALERCIEQEQNKTDNIVEWLTLVGERVFNLAIALSTKGHTQEIEDASNGIFERLAQAVWLFFRPASSKSSTSSHVDYERDFILDRLTAAGISILYCAIKCNNRKAIKIITNVWVTALHNIMVEGNHGKKLLEILLNSRAAKLAQILTRTDVEKFKRLEEADKLARASVELLATAFKRGTEFRPMICSLSQLWLAAIDDIAKLKGGQHEDVKHLISTFVAGFHEDLERKDREKVELWAEIGVEIIRRIATGSTERVLDIIACIWAEMWEESIAMEVEDPLDSLVNRRREEVEECIRNNQHDEAEDLATLALRLLDNGLPQRPQPSSEPTQELDYAADNTSCMSKPLQAALFIMLWAVIFTVAVIMDSETYASPQTLAIGMIPPIPHSQPHHVQKDIKPKLHGIKASLLIPGRGEPIKNACLIIHETKITWVGPSSSLPPKYSSVPYVSVPVLMPGLWDVHVHLFGLISPTTSGFDGLLGSAALAGARTTRDLRNTLMAGFTSVRELGGYGGEISPAIDDGTIVGPHIYSAIAPISMTAGHGDIHNLPIETVLSACAHGLPFAVCDGVPDCIKTVRLMIRRGAKCIKICATGGVFSIIDSPQDTQFSPEELKAMVDEATRAKRAVAAHCHGKEGIIAAINAGVKSIEHGSYLDEECIKLMLEKDVIYCPTASVVEGGARHVDEMPPSAAKKILETASHARHAYKLAIKHGVKIALGTDQASSDPGNFNSHGANGKEIFYAVKAGMTPLQAIEACTAISPETLGVHMAPKSGQLKEGYDADMIALSESPLENISLLSEPSNITHVWKDGKLFKSPECSS
ncbi:hypothetical protein EG329_002919 [Mollisiaceae sp. DMI_Dod_QoI]|nr:hypothetical protein EG329_002919 [Helotiales sp. DMI_Dod_QoI]